MKGGSEKGARKLASSAPERVTLPNLPEDLLLRLFEGLPDLADR